MKTVDLARGHAVLGQDVTVWLGGRGQGGYVTQVDDHGITVSYADIDHPFSWALVTRLTTEIPFDADECLNYGEFCSGPVDWWHSGGMNGRSWPRCTFHGEQRLAERERSIERYADSACAPSWFDPANAGERWEDD